MMTTARKHLRAVQGFCETLWELEVLLVLWGLPRPIARGVAWPLVDLVMLFASRRAVAGWYASWVLSLLGHE